MCRVLAYLGHPILLDELLYQSDSSLIKQSYDPRQMANILNLAGYGMSSWSQSSHDPEQPLVYKSTDLPFHDQNLKNLATKLTTDCLIAHVRGVSFSIDMIVNRQNVHPFRFNDCPISISHNGDLMGFLEIKQALLSHVKPELANLIQGTTDSEVISALILSQLKDLDADHSVDEVSEAIFAAYAIIKDVRAKHGQTVSSPVNLFVSNGKFLIVTRYVFDYGNFRREVEKERFAFHTLWYTVGERYGKFGDEFRMEGHKKESVIFASEPLTRDDSSWLQVTEYSLVQATRNADGVTIARHDIDV